MTSLPRGTGALLAIFMKELRHYTRYPGNLAFLFATPLMFTFMLSSMGSFVGGPNASQFFFQRTGTTNFFVYQILGSAIWIMTWVVIEDLGSALRNEQIKGTLEQNFLAPINRFLLLVGVALAHIVISALIFLGVIFGTVLVLEPSSLTRLLIAMLTLILGLIPMFGIAFVFSGLVIRFKEPYAFTQMVNMIFAIVAGTYYPVSVLPSWVQVVSRSIPQTYVIEDMRLIILFNKSLVDLYGHFIVLGAMAVAYPLLGYYFFKRFERRASVTGDLSKF